MVSVQPGLGCGFAEATLSGISMRKAVVGESAQPCPMRNVTTLWLPALALGCASVTCAEAGATAASRKASASSARIVDLHQEGALREGVVEKIFVVVQIVDADRCRPMIVDTILHPRIHDKICAEALEGLRDGIGIVDGAEGMGAGARRQRESKAVARTIGCHDIGAPFGKLWNEFVRSLRKSRVFHDAAVGESEAAGKFEAVEQDVVPVGDK